MGDDESLSRADGVPFDVLRRGPQRLAGAVAIAAVEYLAFVEDDRLSLAVLFDVSGKAGEFFIRHQREDVRDLVELHFVRGSVERHDLVREAHAVATFGESRFWATEWTLLHVSRRGVKLPAFQRDHVERATPASSRIG